MMMWLLVGKDGVFVVLIRKCSVNSVIIVVLMLVVRKLMLFCSSVKIDYSRMLVV